MTENQQEYFKIKKSQLSYCEGYQIYLKLQNGFIECSPRFLPGTWGVQLYIKTVDRLNMLRRIKQHFEGSLKDADPVEIKGRLTEMMVNTLSLPNPDVLDIVAESFDSFMDMVIDDHLILNKILSLSSNRYSTAEHSINTAALTINFCLQTGFSEDKCYKQYGLAGLFHDIGKAYIEEAILDSTNKLTDEEFAQIKKHPNLGARILKAAKFPKIICVGAAEHHLKLDGSGYPTDQPPRGEISKLLGIIDAFEALTNHSRTYKESHSFSNTCKILKQEVGNGKLDRSLYNEFVKSLRVAKST